MPRSESRKEIELHLAKMRKQWILSESVVRLLAIDVNILKEVNATLEAALKKQKINTFKGMIYSIVIMLIFMPFAMLKIIELLTK